MKQLKRLKRSWALVVGLGLGLVAGLGTGNTANARGTQPETSACQWECTTNRDCDRICGAGAGYCSWQGCTTCLCTM